MARIRYNTERVKKMYNEAVKEINKQLKALAKADPDAVSLLRYQNFFKPITSQKPNYKTTMSMYKYAKKVLDSGELSLQSHERRMATTVETFQRAGLEFVDRSNVMSLIFFLEDARARGLATQYSSTQLAEVWEDMVRQEMSEEEIKKNMKRWEKGVRKDKKGKTIEVENPKPLKVRRYGSRGK